MNSSVKNNLTVSLSLPTPLPQVRDLPGYHLLKACAQREMGDVSEAILSLRLAMSLPGVSRPVRGKESSVSTWERASVFLELVQALRLNGEEVSYWPSSRSCSIYSAAL